MYRDKKSHVAIIDYGMSNVLSVERACTVAGMDVLVTSDRADIATSEAAILPGVGAFGDAMNALHQLDLADLLCDYAVSGKPLLGICLGMQLFMSRSYEFGVHKGLGIVPGEVVLLEGSTDSSHNMLKVPHVGWNHVCPVEAALDSSSWEGTVLEGIDNAEFMYFVHSYYVVPDDVSVRVSMTRYGDIEFCSSLQTGNVIACQFHPEKSGPKGLNVFDNFRRMIENHEPSSVI